MDLLSSTVSVNRRCGELSSRLTSNSDRGLRRVAKHLGRADRERGIEKDRRSGNLAALHQVDQIDDEFLRALDCKCWNEQCTLARRGVADFGGEALAARFGGDRRAISVAIGRFRNHVVEARRRFGIGLEQLGVGPDVAGSEQRAAACPTCLRRRTRSRWRQSPADGRRSSNARARRA